MRRKTMRLMVCAALICGTWALTTPRAFADEAIGSYSDGALRKLGRGIANLGTFPLELIRTPELIGRKEGYVSALSVGVVKGVWRGLVRGVAGVYEIATFYADVPKGFKPLVLPEFVFAHGNWVDDQEVQ